MTQLVAQNLAHVASVLSHALNAVGGVTNLNSSLAKGWATLVEYCS